MKATITITIDGDHITVSAGGGGGSARAPTKSDEAIPAGGSSRPLPGRKGLTIGGAPADDLSFWAKRITESLNNEPNGRFASKNREDLDAIELEISRRSGGTATGASAVVGGVDDDHIPF